MSAKICIKCRECQYFDDCRPLDQYVYCVLSGDPCLDAQLFQDCDFSCSCYVPFDLDHEPERN